MWELKKSRIWETLNVWMCADCSTNTKTDQSNQKGDIREKCVMCYLSHVTCYVSHVNMPKLAILAWSRSLQSTWKRVSAMAQTDTQTHTTQGHCNLETESAQWTDSVKRKNLNVSLLCYLSLTMTCHSVITDNPEMKEDISVHLPPLKFNTPLAVR